MIPVLLLGILTGCTQKSDNNQDKKNMTTLNLTQEWDKVFPLSEKVNHRKVTFETQYGLTLAADLYTPKDAEGKLPAIAVSGPFGATKEQSSGLYAMQMAEPSTLRILARAAVSPGVRPRPTSTPRTSWPPSITCRSKTMWMPSA